MRQQAAKRRREDPPVERQIPWDSFADVGRACESYFRRKGMVTITPQMARDRMFALKRKVVRK